MYVEKSDGNLGCHRADHRMRGMKHGGKIGQTCREEERR